MNLAATGSGVQLSEREKFSYNRPQTQQNHRKKTRGGNKQSFTHILKTRFGFGRVNAGGKRLIKGKADLLRTDQYYVRHHSGCLMTPINPVAEGSSFSRAS